MPEERGGLLVRGRKDDWGGGGSAVFGGGLTDSQLKATHERSLRTFTRDDGTQFTVRMSDDENTPLAYASTARLHLHGCATINPIKGTTEHTSLALLNDSRKRHAVLAPVEKYRAPVTTSQEIGWHVTNPPTMSSVDGGTVTLGQQTPFVRRGKQGGV